MNIQETKESVIQSDSTGLSELLTLQREAYLRDGFPDEKIRRDRVERIGDIHVKYKDRIIEALYEDFSGRAKTQSLIADVLATIMEVKDTKKQIKRWMKMEKRKAPFPMGLLGAKAELHFQPLGVIGNISPWNFPVYLAFSPAIGALAAGNRMMIKPSELVPQTAELIKEMVESAFDREELAVVTGGVEVGKAFSELAFDHLIFTGGPQVAKQVMGAAAKNLVPLTLELGGKCPVLVGESADLELTAKRVMGAKILNSGQLCLTPDYIFLPEGKTEEFVGHAMQALSGFYTSLADSEDYTAVINERHWTRLQSYIDELRDAGVRIEQFNPANESFDSPEVHRLPITLVIDPPTDLKIMQDEIFGPFLSIKTYRTFDETIDFVNSMPRPLALYYFGSDNQQIDRVCKETTSGGITINDVAQHAACHDLPLAGVGNSGMGAYHGREGFLQFSHKKAVYKQGMFSPGGLISPPYTEKQKKRIESML